MKPRLYYQTRTYILSNNL